MTRILDEKHSGFDPDLDQPFTQLRKDIKAFIYVIELLMWCRNQTGMGADPTAVGRLTVMAQEHLARRIDKIYND